MARGSRVKTRTKARSCDGKRKFTSRRAADDAMHAMYRRRLSITRLNVYACDHCDGWHIGHQRFGKRP